MTSNTVPAAPVPASSLLKRWEGWVIIAAVSAGCAVGTKILLDVTSRNRWKPPLVRSMIPWVDNAWALDAAPDDFFRLAEEKYGGIFGVKIAGRTSYYVSSPKLINQIYKQPKIFTISLVQLEWAKYVFAFTERMIPLLGTTFVQQLHINLAPSNMWAILEAYERSLQGEVQSALTQLPTSVSLNDWMMKLLYRASSRAYFGDTFDSDSMWDEWKGFDEGVYRVALGYPTRSSSQFIKSRNAVVERFINYQTQPHNPSQLIANHEEAARSLGLSERETACLLISDWWPLMASVPWGSLWFLILSIQSSHDLNAIMEEVVSAGAAFMLSRPDLQGQYINHISEFLKSNPPLPLFSSTFEEVLRYTTDTYSIRGVKGAGIDFAGYKFDHRDILICRTRSIHMSPAEYTNPEQFMPERFVDRKSSADASPNWFPFGGGVSVCSGRHFAIQHVRMTLVTLLSKFRFKVDNERNKNTPSLGNINRGFGIRRPKDDFFVRVSAA